MLRGATSLTYQILGAGELEVIHSMVFEEILHRLPEVKTLRVRELHPNLVRYNNH